MEHAVTAPDALCAAARTLDALPRSSSARVVEVESQGPADAVARRIEDLGFVPGEPVRVIARGLLGGNPLVVQVGHTRFALRREEARRIRIAPLGEAAR